VTRTPPGDPDERDGGLDRRALLKAAAAPVVAGVVCVLGGSPPRAAAADRPAAEGRGSAMNSKPLMTVRILAGAPQKIGAVAHGSRIIVPVAGGDFEGPRLRGKVLPGGADWLFGAPTTSSSSICASRFRPTTTPRSSWGSKGCGTGRPR